MDTNFCRVGHIVPSWGNRTETFITELGDTLPKHCSHSVVAINSSATCNTENVLVIDPITKLWFRLYSKSDLHSKVTKSLLCRTLYKGAKKILGTLDLGGKVFHQIDVALIEFASAAALFSAYLKEKRIPFLVHFHGYDVTSWSKDYWNQKRLSLIFQRADRLIVASNHIKSLVVLQGANENRLSMIRYGVSLPSGCKPMSWSERRKSIPVICFVGRLTAKKNPLALIHAFYSVLSSASDAELHIVGDGPLHNECMKLVEKLQIGSQVKFYGSMKHSDAMDVLNKSWIFAQHSVTAPNGDQEGFAISPAEAALLNLPVVSTLHNGIPEHVIHGVTGLLSREFDYLTMGENMISLLKDSNRCQEFGEAGRLNILALCNAGTRAEKIMDEVKKAVE